MGQGGYVNGLGFDSTTDGQKTACHIEDLQGSRYVCGGYAAADPQVKGIARDGEIFFSWLEGTRSMDTMFE